MSVASEIARLQNAKASIKTAIENKGVTVGDIKLDAYSAKIDEISTGAEPTGTLEITQNGTYDVKQKAYAKVDVPEPSGNIKITENGFHIIKQYSIAEVAVYPTLVAKTITANGTYNASDDNAYGYGSVSVNVPEKTLTTKTITANGTYNATNDNADGYSQVTVETSGVDINEYYNLTKKSNGKFISYIKNIPLIDTSEYTYMGDMFNSYVSLITIPLLNTSKVINMSSMFYSCKSLTTIPQLDTSNVTNMNFMFSNCDSLTTIPQLDTSKVHDMSSMFYSCDSLTTIPQLDTSKVNDISHMFNGCKSLTTIPQLDTSNVTAINAMFNGCKSLTTIPQLDTSKVNDISSIFYSCNSLTNLGGFTNLGQAYETTQNANYGNYALNLSPCPNLTHDSLMNVINGLYDIANKGVMPQSLILGSTNLAKLTAEEIQIATDKGWGVS